MGTQGRIIKDIQQRCQVRMKIEEMIPGSELRTVRFSGDAQRIETAMGLTMQVLEMGADYALSNFHSAPAKQNKRALEDSRQQQPYRQAAPPRYQEETQPTLALGADGSAGMLYPAVPLSDGVCSQVPQLCLTLLLLFLLF